MFVARAVTSEDVSRVFQPHACSPSAFVASSRLHETLHHRIDAWAKRHEVLPSVLILV